MNSNDLIEKYKFYKIQNNLIRKHKLQNKNNQPKIEINIPLKSNKLEYFPIESDKSKTDGHTIYLVTEESDYNESEKNDYIQNTNQIKQIPIKKTRKLNEHDEFFKQKSIEIQINKQENKILTNNSKKFKNTYNNINNNINNIDVSENQSYEINSIYNNNKTQNIIYKMQNNNLNTNTNSNVDNEPINLDIFNPINTKQVYEENQNKNKNKYNHNNFDILNNSSKTPMYRKKIKFKKFYENNKNENNSVISGKSGNNENIINKTNNTNINNTINTNDIKTKSEIFNKFTELQKNRNTTKEENDNMRKEEKISLTEVKKEDNNNINKNTNNIKEKNCISNENSLQDLFSSNNLNILNRSLDEINHNIDSLYKSLDFVQNKIVEDLNSSKIMEKNFLEGIKNPERKNSLKNAMEKYNRFRSLGKLEKKKNKIFGNSPKSPKLGDGKEIKNGIKETKPIEEQIEIDVNVKEFDNEQKKEENKISNIEEDENENEFSFNSELKKFEKKNNLENIAKETNNIDLNKEINSNDNENINEQIGEKIIDNINTKIDDNNKINDNHEDEDDIINYNISNNIKDNIKDDNINSNNNIDINIIDNNLNNNIIDNKSEIIINQNEFEKEEKEEIKNSTVEEILDNENIEQNILLKKLNKKESPKKFIQEISSPKDNNIDKKQEEIILNKNENNSGNNIINNSINININNESLNKNKIDPQSKFIPINNIKYKTNLKPGFFIRKVVREEHYYVDENGKEKILQVKQEYINNEDKKIMKMKYPYKKKYINLGAYLNMNNTSLNSTLNKEKENDEIKIQNKMNTDINNIFLNNESFDEKNNYEKIFKNNPKPIMTKNREIFTKFNLNDNIYNNNIENNRNQNIFYDQYKTSENNSNYKYKIDTNNTLKENKNIFNLNENKIIDKRVNRKITAPNILTSNINKINIKREKENHTLINHTKNLENKTRLIKPTLKNNYFNNYQYATKALNNSNITFHLNSNTLGNNDTIEETNKNENTLNNIDSYIKVNKVDKFKRMKTEQNLKKLKKINPHNSTVNTNSMNNRKNRESSKNHHAYHEINLTNINKAKMKLSSNSLSHYYPYESNDELNTSNNTNKYSITTTTSERNNIIKYATKSFHQNSRKHIELNNNYKEGNLSNKSSSSSLFLSYRLTNKFNKNDLIQNELNSSNRFNHRYYESKSTKKNKNHNEIYGDYKKKYNYKEIQNVNNKDKNGKYFYSYCDIKNNNNNNNYNTEKKYIRTSQYYH